MGTPTTTPQPTICHQSSCWALCIPHLHRLCHPLTQSVLQRHSSVTYEPTSSLEWRFGYLCWTGQRCLTILIACANVIRVRVRPESSTQMKRTTYLNGQGEYSLQNTYNLSECTHTLDSGQLTVSHSRSGGAYLVRCCSTQNELRFPERGRRFS